MSWKATIFEAKCFCFMHDYFSKFDFSILTNPGNAGANHMCRPSSVSLTPSINFAGVLTSSLTPSSTLTLSGYAVTSGEVEEIIWTTEL
jgi:hypothetical protein